MVTTTLQTKDFSSNQQVNFRHIIKFANRSDPGDFKNLNESHKEKKNLYFRLDMAQSFGCRIIEL